MFLTPLPGVPSDDCQQCEFIRDVQPQYSRLRHTVRKFLLCPSKNSPLRSANSGSTALCYIRGAAQQYISCALATFDANREICDRPR